MTHVDQPGRIARRTVIVGLLAAPSVGLTAAPAQASSHRGAPRLPMSLDSAQLLGGQHVTARGRVGGRLPRTVWLQRSEGTSWLTIASTLSDDQGGYALADPESRGGTYRTVAPRVRSGRKSRPQRVSASRQAILLSGLAPNQGLEPGQYVVSPNGAYVLVMQGDGNLVLYQGSSPLWSTGTGTPGSRAVMQGDGNLVVYGPDGGATWGSATDTFDGANVALQDDGNLVIYRDGRAIWDRHSGRLFHILGAGQVLGVNQWIKSMDHRFVLVMQGDGNLVLYQETTPLWASSTGSPNSYAVMQSDGNLVVYRPDGSPAWASNTADKPGSHLDLQSDSNLVIYQGGTAVWDRSHGRLGDGGGSGSSSGGVIGDDYPSYLRDAGQDSVIDPWRFYNRECTSFVAWRLNNTNHVAFSNYMNGGHFGDAGHWDDNARAIGMRVDDTPAVGAVAQSEGHVAWVAAVGGGTVTIEEYNRNFTGVYSQRTVPTSAYRYIHVQDLG